MKTLSTSLSQSSLSWGEDQREGGVCDAKVLLKLGRLLEELLEVLEDVLEEVPEEVLHE